MTGEPTDAPHASESARDRYECDPDEWARLLDGEELPALEVADRLADARGLSIGQAQEAVYAALEDGPLVEDTEAGGFGAIRLAGECDGETARQRDGETDSSEDG